MRSNEVMRVYGNGPREMYYDPEILAKDKATFTTRPDGKGKVYLAEQGSVFKKSMVTWWNIYDFGTGEMLLGYTKEGG